MGLRAVYTFSWRQNKEQNYISKEFVFRTAIIKRAVDYFVSDHKMIIRGVALVRTRFLANDSTFFVTATGNKIQFTYVVILMHNWLRVAVLTPNYLPMKLRRANLGSATYKHF